LLRCASGLNVENYLGHRLLLDIESIVNISLLSCRDQLAIPSVLQAIPAIFSADGVSGSSPIDHLLSSRIGIEPIDMFLYRQGKSRLRADGTRLDYNVNPGSSKLAVHRKVR